MAYHNDFNQFNFDGTLHHNVLVHPRLQFPAFVAQPVQHDLLYQPYAYQDMFDQLPHGVYPEGYIDDSSEPTTRPRLTPEQQAVLEHQFVTNPKPSSATKKTLAIRTKLSPARVANWFQNRRAKAKQQRKQEEFENSQQQQSAQPGRESTQDQIEDDEDDDEDKQEEEEEEEYIKPAVMEPSSNIWRRKSEPAPLHNPGTQPVDARERAYASLSRALIDAEAGLHRQNTVIHQPLTSEEKFSMAPPEVPRQPALPQTAPSANIVQQFSTHTPQANWHIPQETQQFWPSSPVNASDMNFDFGFDASTTQSLNETIELTSPSNTTCSQTFGGVSPEIWEAPMVTPTMPVHPQNDYRQPLQSPCFPMPSYASSRRPSIADSLTNNLEQIVLTAGTTPYSFPTASSVSSDASDAGVGLAARRKRPGLAPLKGEALRSRSYGTLTALSPTYRQSINPPNAQVLRHTKSSGYSLNNQYAGVRKSSLPRKSPLAASFAESDFQKFMAQKMVNSEEQSQLTPINTNYVSQPFVSEQPVAQFHAHHMPKAASQIPEMPVRAQMVSPPITPFQTDFFHGMNPSNMMPSSIQAQYASTADWTPPYSAGPLTNSSLSDAPLTSPDFAHFSPFPPVQFIPNISPVTRHPNEDINPYPWMFPLDHSPQPMAMQHAPMPSKSADDFKINLYEFPNQKEAHAQATKQLPRAPQSHHNVFVHESANYFNKDKSPK